MVLALIAVLLAIAAPQFVRLYTRVRTAFERDDLERQLTELPEKVRASGRAGVLADPSVKFGRTDGPAELGPSLSSPVTPGSSPGTGVGRGRSAESENPQTLSLDLPSGWTLTVPNPIVYHFSGVCDGGEVIFSLPPLSLHYVLTPPLCRPRLANGR